MMKRAMSLVCALSFVCLFLSGCSSDSSNSTGTGGTTRLVISSLADDMRECAPDLASSVSSVLTVWAEGDNGWSGHVQYGVLKKHFDSTSGAESIYATVIMLDEILDTLAEFVPETALDEDGTQTQGDWTVDYEQVDGDVTLPSIFGGGTVSDFVTTMTVTGMQDSSEYNATFYYKPAETDNIERLFYKFHFSAENEYGTVYATRDALTHDIEVWVACLKSSGSMPASGTAHVDEDFRCLLYFEGNTDAQSFTFKLKTDAADGWAFWGGGSVATDESYIAVRGTDEADSDTYANDGSGITDDSDDTAYVVVSFGDMKDSLYNGGGYPQSGTAALIGAESAELAGYITLGSATCQHASLPAVQAFVYPESATELGFP